MHPLSRVPSFHKEKKQSRKPPRPTAPAAPAVPAPAPRIHTESAAQLSVELSTGVAHGNVGVGNLNLELC